MLSFDVRLRSEASKFPQLWATRSHQKLQRPLERVSAVTPGGQAPEASGLQSVPVLWPVALEPDCVFDCEPDWVWPVFCVSCWAAAGSVASGDTPSESAATINGDMAAFHDRSKRFGHAMPPAFPCVTCFPLLLEEGGSGRHYCDGKPLSIRSWTFSQPTIDAASEMILSRSAAFVM